MQKPIYSPADEEAMMTSLWSPQIADDPESFVMWAFPWGQKGTPLEHFSGPRKWQRRTLRRMGMHIRANREAEAYKVLRSAKSSGRGIGKSALVSWLVLWMLTTRVGSTVIVSANSENQLRTVTWGELTKWTSMICNSHWFEISATKLVPAQWLTEIVERELKKGTRYWAAEGKLWSEENPDAYAGAHNMDGMMVIFDEGSGIPDPIWGVADGFFTENIVDRYFFTFSNPRRNTGYFFECFHAKRDFWETEIIDARTVEGTDKAIYDQIIAEYGEDSMQARIEVFGEFPASGEDQFISPVLVEDAFKREKYKDQTAPIIIGVDPARGGMDSTVIVVRQGRDVVAIKRYKGEDTMTIVGRVIEAIEDYQPDMVVIDEGGLGYGILDRLHEQRFKVVRGVNFGSKSKTPKMYLNRRAELWGEMRNWLRTASIPVDRALKNDLTGVKNKPTSSGVIQLEGKKEMKARGLASPDAADALAVTFAFTVGKRTQVDRGKKRVYSGNSMTTSWMGA